MVPTNSVNATVVIPCSRKYWSAAAESWRRLFVTALSCEAARTFWKAGMAMAASRPMMTTTIMISTRVKPLEERRFFIAVLRLVLRKAQMRAVDKTWPCTRAACNVNFRPEHPAPSRDYPPLPEPAAGAVITVLVQGKSGPHGRFRPNQRKHLRTLKGTRKKLVNNPCLGAAQRLSWEPRADRVAPDVSPGRCAPRTTLSSPSRPHEGGPPPADFGRGSVREHGVPPALSSRSEPPGPGTRLGTRPKTARPHLHQAIRLTWPAS